MIRWTCIGCETPYAGQSFKPCPACKPHRIEAKLKIAVCKTNRCGNWVECGTTGRQGCSLLGKPCQIESKIFKGSGCLADVPLFGPTEIVKEERARIDVCCTNPESIDTSQITFAVTAFNRPDKLTTLLKSLWSRYPSANVMVADTGDQYVDAASLCPPTASVEYFKLPFDAGLSAARNAIVSRLETPYMLLLEDDFIVDERCKIAPMLSVLNAHCDIGVVGGLHEMRYRGPAVGRAFAVKEDQLAPIAMPTHKTTDGVKFQISEFLANFALFRREFVQSNLWDERLKVGEHLAYYRVLRDRNEWLAAFTRESYIGHDRSGRGNEYLHYRDRAKAWSIEAYEEFRHSKPRLPVTDPLCVIVLTCGRSGSSLLASMLHSLGIRMANQFIPPGDQNPSGYFEDAAVHEIVRERDIDVSAFNRLVAIRNATQPAWGFKAPRFLQLWQQLKHSPFPTNTRVLVTVRSEEETIQSLERLGHDRAVLSMPKRHQRLPTVVEQIRQRWPVHEVEYHDAVDNTESVVQRIVEFLGISPSETQISEAISRADANLRHIKP
jgi:hypothetical protein